MSSETASFTDPQFLAHFGLSRINAIEYFLHPLNPFRSKTQTCNEILAMQGISISLLMHHGIGQHQSGPLSLDRAEEEYHSALSRLQGEQYELLRPPPPPKANSKKDGNSKTPQVPNLDPSQSPLFTIRHVLRTKNKVTPLGIYYILEGVIYKSPSARALMKYNVARTCQGLIDACDKMSSCAHYSPTTGYYWDFNEKPKANKRERTSDEHDDDDEVKIFTQLRKKKLSSTAVDKKRRQGDRAEEEDETARAKDKINSILIRMSKSSLVRGT